MSMGLYIPDLRLPADGDFELWIAVRKDGSFTYNVRGGWQDGKQKAVPVSPHGRLIDADALNYTMLYKENWMRVTGVEAPAVWRKDIDAAPTIIPASEEDES